jgi:hypothetical protein
VIDKTDLKDPEFSGEPLRDEPLRGQALQDQKNPERKDAIFTGAPANSQASSGK